MSASDEQDSKGTSASDEQDSKGTSASDERDRTETSASDERDRTETSASDDERDGPIEAARAEDLSPVTQRGGRSGFRGGGSRGPAGARGTGDPMLPFSARRLGTGIDVDLVAGVDLEEETALDVAPIGPTELSVAQRDADGEFGTGPESSGPRSAPATTENLERHIRELEARLDRMMDRGQSERGVIEAAPAAPRVELAPAVPVKRGSSSSRPPAAQTTAREVLSSDFHLRQGRPAATRNRVEEVDEFGFDPQYEARYKPLFDFLYRHYFRVEVDGIERIPDEGRCIVVSNHSGGPIPYDGLMQRTAFRLEHPRHRELRWLAEDFVYYLPFAGTVMNRIGAVRACQENAERLLGDGGLVGVFPEGVKGIGKVYKDRYRLQRFGRGGFIRLCLRTRTPLVPCAIVGAEETTPLLHRLEFLTQTIGISSMPLRPTFPVLGLFGLVPAPTKWKMRFGEMIRFDQYGPEAADDEILVGRLTERVRMTIQGIIDQTLAERKSIWFG